MKKRRAGGNLTASIAFDAPTGASDAFGGSAEAWTPHYACRAEWIYGKGDESVQASRQAGRKAYKVRVRACDAARAVTEDYRMRDVRAGTSWNIVEVDAISIEAQRSMSVYFVVEGPLS